MNHFEHVPGDSALIDKIVCEVKSQGAFDQFRRECISDVDTKPAYQNLRQRVEGSVASFLGGQHWRPDMNKNQLREKLRRHITDTGFLETGVERIVDQVVNPKINTVFLSTIEDISYKYLGIEKPKPSLADCMAAAQAAQPPPTPLHPPAPVPPPPPPHSANASQPPHHHHHQHHHHTGGLTVDIPPGTGHTFLPTDDLELEAVSPDSDKTGASATAGGGSGDDSRNDDHAADGGGDDAGKSVTTTAAVDAAGSNANEDDEFADTSLANHNRSAGTIADDFESPAFEPLEGRTSSALSNRGSTIDRRETAADDDGDNSKLSAISGLTSQDSIGSNRSGAGASEAAKMPHESFSSVFDDEVAGSPQASANAAAATDATNDHQSVAATSTDAADADEHPADKHPSHSAQLDHSSELSQVSSNSRLSIVTTTDRESPAGRPDDHCDEAQMPRFNENSSNSHNANAATDAAAMPQPAAVAATANSRPLQTSFVDINKQDEIQFEGTRRHSICVDIKAEAAAAESAAASKSGPPMSIASSPVPTCANQMPINLPADTLQPLLPVAPPPVPAQMVPVLTANGATAADNGLKSTTRRSQSQSMASSMSLSSCTSSSSSISSSNLIIAETKSLTLNGDDEDDKEMNHNGHEDVAAVANKCSEMGENSKIGSPIVTPMELDETANKSVADVAKDAQKPVTLTTEPFDTVAELPAEPTIAVPAIPTTDDFKFETPAVDGSESRDKSRESSGKSAEKSRHSSHSRSHNHSSSSRGSSSHRSDKKSSSTSGSADKDKDKDRRHRTSSSSSSSRHGTHSSRDKDKRDSTSSHRDAKDSKSKDPKDASSSHRTSSSSSKPSHGRSSSSSSSSKHHHHTSSSSSSSHRHHSSSSSARHAAGIGGDSKSSSSSSSSGKSAAAPNKPKTEDKDAPGNDDACNQRSLERRRSNDQDSNDGHPSASNASDAPATTAASTSTSGEGGGATNNNNPSQVESNASDDTQTSQSATRTETAEDFVLPSPPPLPVLVDQILTGAQPTDTDLERLIAQSAAAGSDPVLSSIRQTIASSSSAALKRPKVASNIYEARKLIKVRKQMERDEKKRLEQALVLAKQYLSANATVANTLGLSVRDGGQGVELEFACVTGASNAAPSISSPMKTALPAQGLSATAAADDEDFNGFGAAVAASQPVQVLVSEEVFEDDDDDGKAHDHCDGDGSDDDDSVFRGFDTADTRITVATATFVRQANELFAQCALFASESSPYSQSVHLQRADAHIIDTFRQLCPGDVWLYAGGSTERQAKVRRPETVAKLNQWTVDGHHQQQQQQQLSPDSHSRARLTRRPKSQSESRVSSHKRTSPSQTVDAAALQDGFRPRRIKIDARIRMVSAANSAAMDTDDLAVDLETDDDGQSVMSMRSDATIVTGSGRPLAAESTTTDDDDGASDGLRPKSTTVQVVSPTPSDQSVSSKENNFVPKIKKAVSRSLAHNSSVMAAAAAITSAVSAPAATSIGGSGSATAVSTPATIVAFAQQPLVALQKKASQRYTSEDLYKPRPILSAGSRSRRRGDFDNGDI